MEGNALSCFQDGDTPAVAIGVLRCESNFFCSGPRPRRQEVFLTGLPSSGSIFHNTYLEAKAQEAI